MSDDALQQLEAEIAEARRRRGAATLADEQLPLVVLPLWSDPVLATVGAARGDVPVQPIDCDDDGGPWYQAAAGWRAHALASLAGPAGRSRLTGLLPRIAAALRGVPLPRRLDRWASLAAGGDGTGIADRLDAIVEQVAARPVPGGGAPDRDYHVDDILDWMEAARPLADALRAVQDSAVDFALVRAGRRIELLRRSARDERYLAHYVPQRGLDDEFLRLVDPANDTTWGLHYVGAAGAGKTMLIRHLVTHLAEPQGIATARLDFDHLNPDYPYRDPGLFYWSMMTELRRYLPDGAERDLASMKGWLGKLKEELASTGGDPLRHTLFHEATLCAIEILNRVAAQTGRRVVLILDTCEELARHRVDGKPSEALLRTFDILEALKRGPAVISGAPHPGAPELCVVLAGRRLLAGAGDNFDAPHSTLPPRRYLRRCDVRGFDHAEAVAYFDKVGVAPGYRAAILDATRDPAGHHLPFDVGLLADWTGDEAPPRPEEIRAARGERYVELRIVRRLRSPALERALPALVALGHFDRSLVASAVDSDDRGEVLSVLPDQEWLLAESWGAGEAYSIDPRLLPRFEAFYGGRSLDGDLRARVLAHLDARLLDDDLTGLDWQLVDVALRLRGRDPLPALWAWWRRFEERILAQRAPGWCEDLLRRLRERALDERTASWTTRSARAVVEATLGCVGGLGLAPTDPHHDGGVPALIARARARELEAIAREDAVPPAPRVAALCAAAADDDALDDTTRLAIRATLSILIRAADLRCRARGGLPDDEPWLAAVPPELLRGPAADPSPLDVLGEHIQLRLQALRGSTNEAAHGLALLSRRHRDGNSGDWLREEYARWAYDWGADLSGWLDDMTARARRGEGGRPPLGLIAAWLRAKATRALLGAPGEGFDPGPIIAVDDGGVALAIEGAPVRDPSPLLRVTIAECVGDAGWVSRALESLSAIAIESSRHALDAARAQARLIRAYRLWEIRQRVPELLRESPDPDDGALVAAIDGLAGRDVKAMPVPPRDGTERDARWVHAQWRSLRGLGPDEAMIATGWWRTHGEGLDVTSRLWRLILAIDAQEASALAGPAVVATTPRWPTLPYPAAADWFALALRVSVLMPDPDTRAWIADAAPVLGYRRAAAIALDEAEMLSLRLPAFAGPLFELACTWHQHFRDAAGLLRARIGQALLVGGAPGMPRPPSVDDAAWGPLHLRLRLIERAAAWDEIRTTIDVDVWRGSADLRAAAARAGIELGVAPRRERVPRLDIAEVETVQGTRTATMTRYVRARWTPIDEPPIEVEIVSPNLLAPYAEIDPDEVLAAEVASIDDAGVELAVADPLQGLAWEAWMWRQCGRWPVMWRTVAAPPALPPRDAATPSCVVMAAPRVRAWLRGERATFDDAADVDPVRPGQAVDVIHLVGIAREVGSSSEVATFSLGDPFAAAGAGDPDSETTWAYQLRRNYPRTRLVVVHDLPVTSGTPARTTTTRLQAYAARRFVAELADDGAAVVYLPPLAPPLSAAASQLLVDRIRDVGDGAVDLARAIAEVRTLVAEGSDAETALDVCLFASSAWISPFARRPR